MAHHNGTDTQSRTATNGHKEGHSKVELCEIIVHTSNPLPGIEHLGSAIYENDLIQFLKVNPRGKSVLNHLILFINDAFHLDEQKMALITADEIEMVQICPDNHSIWLIQFAHRDDELHRCVKLLHPRDQSHEPGGGNASSGDQNHESPSPDASSNEQAAPNKFIKRESQDFDLSDFNDVEKIEEVVGSHLPSMTVGIIEHTPHDSSHFFEKDASHSDVVARIISDGMNGKIKVRSFPMTTDGSPPTVFDMICALSRPEIQKVQVVNISQGFQTPNAHLVLKKVLQDIEKPIVCSAGDEHQDNDTNPNWPSNFSRDLDHVYAVTTNLEDGTAALNYGNETVTLCGPGKFGDHIFGTSFAAAWFSRMVALAYLRKSNTTMSLEEIVEAVHDLYNIEENYLGIPTASNLRLSKERIQQPVGEIA